MRQGTDPGLVLILLVQIRVGSFRKDLLQDHKFHVHGSDHNAPSHAQSSDLGQVILANDKYSREMRVDT
jgi:hypothetical protein